MLFLLLLGTAALSTGQGLPTNGSPGCTNRVVHLTHEGHDYLFSWEDPRTSQLELNWIEAREFCLTHCMDLVGLETKEENILIKERLAKGNQTYAWTGGRKCNYEGCDRPDLKPVDVYGWFWVGSHKKLPPTTNRLDADWSDTGGLGVPQPDDRERMGGGPGEDCLALLNNIHSDGVRWHDIACHHRKPFICEDSDVVPYYIRSEVPEVPVDIRVGLRAVPLPPNASVRTSSELDAPTGQSPAESHDVNNQMASS